jgi:SAM-dependent methyltransferase
MPDIIPPKPDLATPYSGEYFDTIERGSLQSARVVVPLVLELARPRSVLDVGCGRGAWLRGFQEFGVKSVKGVDGDYVDTANLLIPQECFSPIDLNKPFELAGKYDLAICLEVAEHLPAAMASILVQQLTRAAQVVLFSAAIPGQGGEHHVNERLPSYWRELFEVHRFTMFDPIRPTILGDPRVEWWYRQNMVVYAAQEAIDRLPQLETHRVPADALGIEWVHIHQMGVALSARDLCRQLPAALNRAIRWRLSGGRAG